MIIKYINKVFMKRSYIKIVMHRKMSPLRNSEYEGITISSYIIIFISKLNMINTMLSYISTLLYLII